MKPNLRTTAKIVSAIGFTMQFSAIILSSIYPNFERVRFSDFLFSVGLVLNLLGVGLIFKYNRQNKKARS